MRAFLALAALALAVTATPTNPVKQDVGSLPVSYLVTDKHRTYFDVTTRKPSSGLGLVAVARYNASNAALGWDYLHVKGYRHQWNTSAWTPYFDAGFP